MEEDIIEVLGNAENIDLISLLRTFKKEGTENFIVVRKNKFNKLIQSYKENEAVIEEMAKYIKNPYKVNIISKGRMSRHQAIIEYFRNKVKGKKHIE